jgi:hypothetical protein
MEPNEEKVRSRLAPQNYVLLFGESSAETRT